MCLICSVSYAAGAGITIRAVNQPAASVFRSIVTQTGKNFVYSSDILKNLRVTVDVKDKPLKKVLSEIFENTEIEYKIKGQNIILKKKAVKKKKKDFSSQPSLKLNDTDSLDKATMLEEVVILSRLEKSNVETAEIGARKISADEVRNTPAMFGESDVIKTIHTQAGVTENAEGMAGMNVHGGDTDQNLYMLENVPLYQANHFAGLFSAFNTDLIRYIDFYKSSVPARFDGRLSSFMDVRLKNGNRNGHHGSARLGLTSGAFNISGPIGKKTAYLVGIRRSWFDIVTIPILAIINSRTPKEKTRFGYSFMDFNARLSHNFNDRHTGFLSFYFGNDFLKMGSKEESSSGSIWFDDYKIDLKWGNLVVQTGLNSRFSDNLSAEFTAAYTRFFSSMKNDDKYLETENELTQNIRTIVKTDNNINDWIFRGDFRWDSSESNTLRFGAGYTRHSFLPARTTRNHTINAEQYLTRDSVWSYGANEINIYAENEWSPNEHIAFNAGIHASLFNIEGKLHSGISPRLSAGWRPLDNLSVKASFTRTVQYVHQLSQTYFSLPTDQWIPVTGNFKPETAEKIAAGIYWQTSDGNFTVSAEAYYKWMHNLIDYRDEYYLNPPLDFWGDRLTSGKGSAKGVDITLEKTLGKVTGRIAYSLAWADRTFKDKNGGKRYPARFDNRHTIKLLVNWKVSERVQIGAIWTGHSGNRFTLLTQAWESPDFGGEMIGNDVPLKGEINNYQLPFYHRLDLSCNVMNRRGFWTFSLFNAYCNMNTSAIVLSHRSDNTPVFKRIKLFPIIPSVSYTWQF